METEEEEERQNKTKELQSSPYDERFGTDSRGNDRADRKLAASKYGVLERAKKNRQYDNASISDICRKVVVSCGVHCGGGGEVAKNRCGYSSVTFNLYVSTIKMQ